MNAEHRLYKRVGLGGTFDQLHKGHIILIAKALEIGDYVVIGLTTDEMLKKNPKAHTVAKYKDRVRELTKFLNEKGVIGRVQVIPIDNTYGSALSDGAMEAVIVGNEAAERAEKINELRANRGLKPLKLIKVTMVLAEDKIPISTTRIRKGEIDRKGCLVGSKVLV